MTHETPEQLNARLDIGKDARFEIGQGGLTRLTLDGAVASGQVYLHGAHVTAWQPAGHAPVLWMSPISRFEPGHPIRGGVPLCFPWFGPHPHDPQAPAHGLARLETWQPTALRRTADGDLVVELQRRIADFDLTYTVSLGRTLTMTLHILNRAAAPRRAEVALHTYFTVGDVKQVQITGLGGTIYVDKVAGGTRRRQGDEPIMFHGETDRVYLNTQAACVLDDPVLLRRITVEKSGSNSTVVWNPWIDKARRMPDFPDDGWPGMCCIETASVADDALQLPPGGDHAIIASLSVARTA